MLHLVVRSLAQILYYLPFGFSAWLARRAGDAFYILVTSRRKIAFRNLDIAYRDSLSPKQKKQLARRSFQNIATSVLEIFLIPKMTPQVHSRFRMVHSEFLENAFKKEKGVILVISHLGSWEYLSFLPYLTKKKWSVIVRDIRNPYFDREVNLLRKMTMVNPIPKEDSIREVMRELKRNHGVAVLIDQWAGREGVWQDFFGEPTSTTSIPARLALRLGSPLVPAYCMRTTPGFYNIEIHPPVSVETGDENQITAQLNTLLEAQIRKHPDQWLWLHRRWKDKPESNRQTSED